MKVGANDALRWGIVVLLSLASVFWYAARLTHMRCCSQDWVDSAPTEVVRNDRAKVRAWNLSEVANLRRKTYRDSLICVGAAAIMSGLYLASRISRKKAVTQRETKDTV